ncbi:MAG: hypothetical protein RLZZ435_3141 [Cyanobacteriota bacterium]|jgi:pimeloyl-ACP methyl ester carboxylesterase
MSPLSSTSSPEAIVSSGMIPSPDPNNGIARNFPVYQWHWQNHAIRYTVMGEGQPLLLVHGFGASIGHWRKNIPTLVQAGYQVYALDLLGFGASDKPILDYSLDLWQALLESFWQTQIARPVVLVGNSIGGLLSLMLTVKHPEWVRGSVLLNCAGGLNHRPEELHFPLQQIMGLFSWAVNHPHFGPFLFNGVRRKSQIRRTLYQVYGNREAVTDELVDLLYEPSCHPQAQKVFASILSAPAGPAPTELLPHLERPLLVLWGEADPWTPLSGGKIFQTCDRSDLIQFQSLPETGHCPHDDRPDVTNPLILDWLEWLTQTHPTQDSNRSLA